MDTGKERVNTVLIHTKISDDDFGHEQGVRDFEFLYTYIFFALVVIFFSVTNRLIKHYGTPKASSYSVYGSWLWRNLSVSLLHGLLVGIWSIMSFFEHLEDSPTIYEDPLYYFNTSSYLMMIASTAYFFYDAMDIVLSRVIKKNKEIIIHHFVILFSFGYYWHAKVGIGYAHMSLLSEFSSFLLHARKLTRIIGFSSDSLQYHIFSIVNLVSFFILRLIPLSFVVSNIYPEYLLMRVHIFYFSTLSLSATIIFVINVGFFLKLIRTDLIRVKQKRK